MQEAMKFLKKAQYNIETSQPTNFNTFQDQDLQEGRKQEVSNACRRQSPSPI